MVDDGAAENQTLSRELDEYRIQWEQTIEKLATAEHELDATTTELADVKRATDVQKQELEADWAKRLTEAQAEAQEQNARQTKQNSEFAEGFDSLRKQLGVVSGDAATLKAEIKETRAQSAKYQSLAEKLQRDHAQTLKDLTTSEASAREGAKELTATTADLQEHKEELEELRDRMKESRASSSIASTLGTDLQMMKQLQAAQKELAECKTKLRRAAGRNSSTESTSDANVELLEKQLADAHREIQALKKEKASGGGSKGGGGLERVQMMVKLKKVRLLPLQLLLPFSCPSPVSLLAVSVVRSHLARPFVSFSSSLHRCSSYVSIRVCHAGCNLTRPCHSALMQAEAEIATLKKTIAATESAQ